MTKGLHVLSKNINATALTLPLFWGPLLVGLWFLHMLAIPLLGVLICTLFYVFSLEVNSTTHQVTPFPKVTFSVCLLSFGLSLEVTHPYLQPRYLWRFVSHAAPLRNRCFLQIF